MFLCHHPLSKDKLGSRPTFDKSLSQGSPKEKRSVVDLVSKGAEVNCVSVQNLNWKTVVLRVIREQRRHRTFSNWKHVRRMKLQYNWVFLHSEAEPQHPPSGGHYRDHFDNHWFMTGSEGRLEICLCGHWSYKSRECFNIHSREAGGFLYLVLDTARRPEQNKVSQSIWSLSKLRMAFLTYTSHPVGCITLLICCWSTNWLVGEVMISFDV